MRNIPRLLTGLLLISSLTGAANDARAASINDEICNPKAERNAERELETCHARKSGSTKVWKDLATAKGDIEFHLRGGTFEPLSDYLMCDTNDPLKREAHCKADLPVLGSSAIQKIALRTAKRSEPRTWKWKDHPTDVDRTLLCELPADSPSVMHRPSYGALCAEDGSPIIELRKVTSGFAISGVSP